MGRISFTEKTRLVLLGLLFFSVLLSTPIEANENEKPSEQQRAATRAKIARMLGTDQILFLKRHTYNSNHYYTEYINSSAPSGGQLCLLSLEDGSVRDLAPELSKGIFGRFDLSFDARRIVFDWKRSPDEGYRLYEIGIDGTGLRQLTFPVENEARLIARYHRGYHHGTDDMHPCYLPDGGIVFISTRCQSGVLCDGSDSLTTTNLYRIDADGGNLRRLSYGALSEATPTVMPDGRILYTRWEYVDKGAVAVKCLWAMRPDGSGSSEIYGNDIAFPTTLIQGRPIPGEPNRYVVLGTPHYPQAAYGTVVRLDLNRPIRTHAPIELLTPRVTVLDEAGWHFRNDSSQSWQKDRQGRGPLFRDPYPIDRDHFLVAHKPAGAGPWTTTNGYGLYLLEAGGHVEPFFADPAISCWQPLPVRPRKRPPVLPSEFDPQLAQNDLAACVVIDVYHGLERVPRGTVKYLRVLEQISRPWSARRPFGNQDSYDQQHACVSKDTALGLKVQHGIIPVEADGSAYFTVPARANLFFQALDENLMAVQTERTFVNFMPGEKRSCVGCHETPDDGPPKGASHPIALTRDPSSPGPQPGETTARRVLHYPTDVQPVWDRYCIECHNEKVHEGGLDLTGRETEFFSASYENLLPERRQGRTDRLDPGLVPTIGENHPKTGNVHYLPAKSLGSHNSLLVAMLAPDRVRLDGAKLAGDEKRLARLERLIEAHREIRLPSEALLKVTNWVDTNGQYYGSYFGRRNRAFRDHPNYRPVPTWESACGTPPLPEEKR